MRANGGCATSKSFVEVFPTSKTGEQSAIRENIRGHGDEFTLGEIMLWCSICVFFKVMGVIYKPARLTALTGKVEWSQTEKYILLANIFRLPVNKMKKQGLGNIHMLNLFPPRTGLMGKNNIPMYCLSRYY